IVQRVLGDDVVFPLVRVGQRERRLGVSGRRRACAAGEPPGDCRSTTGGIELERRLVAVPVLPGQPQRVTSGEEVRLVEVQLDAPIETRVPGEDAGGPGPAGKVPVPPAALRAPL